MTAGIAHQIRSSRSCRSTFSLPGKRSRGKLSDTCHMLISTYLSYTGGFCSSSRVVRGFCLSYQLWNWILVYLRLFLLIVIWITKNTTSSRKSEEATGFVALWVVRTSRSWYLQPFVLFWKALLYVNRKDRLKVRSLAVLFSVAKIGFYSEYRAEVGTKNIFLFILFQFPRQLWSN